LQQPDDRVPVDAYPQRLLKGDRKPQKALMHANIDIAHGIVTVNCPYCLIGPKGDKVNGFANPVDVTKFVEHAGEREHKTSCNKGHVLRFRTISEWREERQKAGIQKR